MIYPLLTIGDEMTWKIYPFVARPSIRLPTFDKLGEICKVWRACDKRVHIAIVWGW